MPVTWTADAERSDRLRSPRLTPKSSLADRPQPGGRALCRVRVWEPQRMKIETDASSGSNVRKPLGKDGDKMPTAMIMVLVAVGSVVFHVLSPWWWTPIASNWGYIDSTLIITFWITGAVFVAVVLFMAYCVFRFRHGKGARPHYEPENKRLEWWLTVATGDRRRRHAGAGPLRLAPVRDRAGRGDRRRDRRPAMVVELPPARQGRQARHLRRPQRQRRQSARPQPERSERQGRRGDRERRPAPADRQAGQDPAALRSTCCTISTCPSSAARWTWCRAR